MLQKYPYFLGLTLFMILIFFFSVTKERTEVIINNPEDQNSGYVIKNPFYIPKKTPCH